MKPQDDPDVKRKYSHIRTIDCQCHSMLVACARDIESSRSKTRANFISSGGSHRDQHKPTHLSTHANSMPSCPVLPYARTVPTLRPNISGNPCQTLENLWGGGGVDMCLTFVVAT